MGEVAMILSRPRSSWNGTGFSNLASVIRAIPLAVVAPICDSPSLASFVMRAWRILFGIFSYA